MDEWAIGDKVLDMTGDISEATSKGDIIQVARYEFRGQLRDQVG